MAHATNGVLQGCPLSMIVIDVLTSTQKRIMNNLMQSVVVCVHQGMPTGAESGGGAGVLVEKRVRRSRLVL